MTEETKTKISAKTEGYTKTKAASGSVSLHNGDAVAVALVGLTLAEVVQVASEALDTPQKDLEAKYQHLNPGQQRMNLGNRIRGVVNKMNKAAEAEDFDGVTGDEYIATIAEPHREAVAKREAEVAEAKAKAEAERKAKAEAKAAEKEAKAKAGGNGRKRD